MHAIVGNTILSDRVRRRDRIHRTVTGITGVVVGSVFYYAGFMKSSAPQETLDALAYAFSDTGATLDTLKAAVYVLVVVEIMVATSLVTGVWGRAGRIMAASLLMLFTAWLLLLVATGAGVPCGCGLRDTWLLPGDARTEAILRNATLLVMLGVDMVVRRWASTPTFRTPVTACNASHHSVPV